VPIVAVTAFDTAECRRAAEAVGCNDYVAKPVDYERITSLLRRFLPAPLQQRESAPLS